MQFCLYVRVKYTPNLTSQIFEFSCSKVESFKFSYEILGHSVLSLLIEHTLIISAKVYHT